jgi:hypothetical protein
MATMTRFSLDLRNVKSMSNHRHLAPGDLPFRVVPASVLALIALFPSGLIQAPVLAQTVCMSPSFGQLPRNNPDRPNCAGATTSQQIYWVPGISKISGLGTCVLTGDVSAALSTNPNPAIVNLLNLEPSRIASVTGNGNANVLVGSPSTSDRLIGGGGLDTYVVGGLDATIVVAASDSRFVYSTSAENDIITFGASQEYIYINTPTGNQDNPGPLDTPPASGLGSVTPGGASKVSRTTRAKAQALSPCLAATPRVEPPLVEGLNPPLLAWLPSASPSDQGGLLSQVSPGRDPGLERCATGVCAGNGTPSSPNAVDPKGFPGAPSLVGFGLAPGHADRIFVPARGFSFQGIPINRFIRPGQPIKVLVVNDVSFRPGGVISPRRLNALLANARGLENVRSAEAPLVYFRQNGLLVFSQNSQPLGSRENPGRVLAQLLDAQGRPLPLSPSPGQRYYNATFLQFLPG